MENNNLINTWEQQKHVPDNEKLDNKMLTDYLKPKVSKVSWTLKFNLLSYIAALVASIVLLSMNLYGYSSNPVMLTVEAVLLLYSLIFLGYGVFIFMKIREINNYSKDLRELLETKIKFLRFHYEIWLIITAVIVWILSFALNTLIDNQDGFYRINKPGFFILVSIVMLCFIYLVQKLSAWISLRNLKSFLQDLEVSSIEQTAQMEQRKKKLRWIFIAGIIILLALLIFGVIKAVSRFTR
jgi:hypothetical protein